MNKLIMALMFGLSSLFAVAYADFSENSTISNPFSWDNDAVSTSYREYWYGVVFELDQGTDVELGSITVTCSSGRICYSAGLRDYVQRGRAVYIGFPNWLDVVTVAVKSKP